MTNRSHGLKLGVSNYSIHVGNFKIGLCTGLCGISIFICDFLEHIWKSPTLGKNKFCRAYNGQGCIWFLITLVHYYHETFGSVQGWKQYVLKKVRRRNDSETLSITSILKYMKGEVKNTYACRFFTSHFIITCVVYFNSYFSSKILALKGMVKLIISGRSIGCYSKQVFFILCFC